MKKFQEVSKDEFEDEFDQVLITKIEVLSDFLKRTDNLGPNCSFTEYIEYLKREQENSQLMSVLEPWESDWLFTDAFCLPVLGEEHLEKHNASIKSCLLRLRRDIKAIVICTEMHLSWSYG